MKMNQNDSKFQPITITLETRAEAKAFLGIVNKCEPDHSIFTESEKTLLRNLSNHLADMEVFL